MGGEVKGYVIGPPPLDMIIHRVDDKWRGRDDLHSLVHLKMCDEKKQPLNPERIMLNEELFVTSRCRAQNNRAAYGGMIYREVFARPTTRPADLTVDPILEWGDLLGPIQAWEAWEVTVNESMAYQGIELLDGKGRYRIYLPDSTVTTVIGFGLQLIDTLRPGNLMQALRRVWDVLETQDMHRLADMIVEDSKFIDNYDVALGLLLITEFIGETRVSWRLPDIWRLIDHEVRVQAQAFDLKPEHLLERIERRRRAIERGR